MCEFWFISSETLSDQTVRFLLIEDDADHAALVLRCLERCDVNCIADHVTDGVEGVEYLREAAERKQLPDVVLLDLNLPKLNGHEVLAKIRADAELKLLTVIVLSTSDNASDRCRAFDNFANSYVVKPLDFAAFRDMIGDLSLYWSKWHRAAPVSGSD